MSADAGEDYASRWSQFVIMAFGQPHELYKSLFAALLRRCQTVTPAHGFRFNNELYSMDASMIDLCLSVFPWGSYRKAKGGIKLHVAMNHKGNLPEFVTVTEARTHEVNEGRRVDFPKGSIVAVDRGYTDYEWYKTLSDKGVYFVARLKSNATTRIVERREVDRSKGLSSDHTIEFTGVTTSKRCPIALRRIRYRDPTTGKRYEFLTNNFSLAASTIAAIYKSRWQIELFFKWIKQNLKIKSFLGTSKNAVMTQIWIALCVYLLIAYLKFVSKSKKSMQQILNLLQMNLFEKWYIHDLIHGKSTERIPINPDQLSFADKLTGHYWDEIYYLVSKDVVLIFTNACNHDDLDPVFRGGAVWLRRRRESAHVRQLPKHPILHSFL